MKAVVKISSLLSASASTISTILLDNLDKDPTKRDGKAQKPSRPVFYVFCCCYLSHQLGSADDAEILLQLSKSEFYRLRDMVVTVKFCSHPVKKQRSEMCKPAAENK